MINKFSCIFILFVLVSAVSFCFSDDNKSVMKPYSERKKTEITGKIMTVKNAGKEAVFSGGAKIVRASNTITADNMIYYKQTDTVNADGNVKFKVINNDGSVINAKSQKATYNVKNYDGKLWDGNPIVEYKLKDSTDTVFLLADTVEINKNFESAKAQDNVKIISSSGTITSDNAFLNRNDNSLVMKKDKKKPQVDVKQDDKEAHFKADNISLFYDTKTVKMNNNVEGKIIIEDINNLEIKK